MSAEEFKELDRLAELAMIGFLASSQSIHVEGVPQTRSPELIAAAAYQQAHAMRAAADLERHRSHE